MKEIITNNSTHFKFFLIILLFIVLSGCNGVTPTGYTITATAGAGGSISPSGAILVTEGSNQTFIIIPDEGYEIADVLVDGTSEGIVASYTFPNIQQNHTIQVSFTGLGVYNTHIGLYYHTIQEAIDASLDGETILISLGTYHENILFDGRDITVRSTDPLDCALVAATIIDGGGNASVVRFTGVDTSTMAGFTIQNENADKGGGIYVKGFISPCSPIITSNNIGHNTAKFGGGIIVDYTSATITGNYITFNTATNSCGGMYVYIEGNCLTVIGGNKCS